MIRTRKKSMSLLAFVLVFIMVCGSFLQVHAHESEDLNTASQVVTSESESESIGSNRPVNISDVIWLRRYIEGYDVEIDRDAADVNQDGVIDYNDVIALREYLAGVSTNSTPPRPIRAITPNTLSRDLEGLIMPLSDDYVHLATCLTISHLQFRMSKRRQ